MNSASPARRPALALLLAALLAFAPAVAAAHPHVWVTVRSKIGFADGKVVSVTHDWVFDEMYSSFATQGLAKPGELVTRDIFAPLARENAGGLAEIGYFTTLKIGGKAVEFGPVKDGDYWMEERPDHLVAFHVDLHLKTPTAPGRYFSLLVADPEYFIDFEFDDNDAIALVVRALRLLGLDRQAEAARRPGPAEAHRILLHQLGAGNQLRLQDGEPRHRRLPMIRFASLRRAAPVLIAALVALARLRPSPSSRSGRSWSAAARAAAARAAA